MIVRTWSLSELSNSAVLFSTFSFDWIFRFSLQWPSNGFGQWRCRFSPLIGNNFRSFINADRILDLPSLVFSYCPAVGISFPVFSKTCSVNRHSPGHLNDRWFHGRDQFLTLFDLRSSPISSLDCQTYPVAFCSPYYGPILYRSYWVICQEAWRSLLVHNPLYLEPQSSIFLSQSVTEVSSIFSECGGW